MTPQDRIPVAIIILWCLAWVGWLVFLAWRSTESTSDVRYIDAPMEQAHERANGGWR